MPKLPQQMVKEGIKRLGEVYMLEQICYLMPQDPPENYVAWEGSGDILPTKAKRNTLVRGMPASPISSAVALLCKAGEMVRGTITKLGSLLEANIIRTRWLCLTAQSEATITTVTGKFTGPTKGT